MTTPTERTRNVIQARRFMESLMADERLPEDVRQKAWHLLRHYPLDSDVLLAGEIEEAGAKDILSGPVFASSVDGLALPADDIPSSHKASPPCTPS